MSAPNTTTLPGPTPPGRPASAGHDTERTAPGDHADDLADAAPLRVAQIGRFIVLRRLGAGGMGVVYLAYDNQLDRRVAVKLIRSLGAPHPETTARMRREAQAMARLSHPNVLQIYEVGASDGALFLAMEYVRGGSLAAWLARRDPAAVADWRATVAMFVQAGRGLAAAHQAGLVHRDFKPNSR
ncbi:MAG: serine/threonine protein kinase [Myxococcales bacterium]|nr:serine/threonine protein kinase [Myxococcales bacterium]